MTTLLLTIGTIGSIMLAMAIGFVITGKRLKGSCGGVGGAECACENARKNACALKSALPPQSI